MSDKRIHLIAPAAPCGPFLRAMKLDSAPSLIEHVQHIVGSDYRVTGDVNLLDAEEDERAGGRTDDRARAKDLEAALSDSAVAAMIAVRGGAWFTRILPSIDFSVLDRRSTRIAVFGFSEVTPLINIVGAHRNGLGLYSMGPAFLTYGLRRYAATQRDSAGGSTLPASDPPVSPLVKGGGSGSAGASPAPSPHPYPLPKREGDPATPQQWMETQLRDEFRAYFEEVVSILEGRHGELTLTARLVSGDVSAPTTAAFTGGNLTVLSPMIGSRFADAIDPRGRWLLLEDFNDKPERFDRFLSHLTLAGFWDRCAGVLLGDFHNADGDLLDAIVALLPYHLPANRSVPVMATPQVGHIWPMTPMPLHAPATIEQAEDYSYVLRWRGSALKIV